MLCALGKQLVQSDHCAGDVTISRLSCVERGRGSV